MLDSLPTLFALSLPPLVAVIFACLIWFKRDPITQPSIVAAIPLSICTIAILLSQGAVTLLRTFQEIATTQTGGIRAVIEGVSKAQRPLIYGFIDVSACLAILILISVFLRYSRDTETPPIHAYLAFPALIVLAAVLAAAFWMVYLQYGTVDLVMMIVDNHRNHELTAQYGTVNPAYFASRVSSRLVIITFGSVVLFFALIIAGALNLVWRQKQNGRPAFATVLVAVTVIGCVVSALSESAFVDYLTHVH